MRENLAAYDFRSWIGHQNLSRRGLADLRSGRCGVREPPSPSIGLSIGELGTSLGLNLEKLGCAKAILTFGYATGSLFSGCPIGIMD